jgi:hypothetical protein
LDDASSELESLRKVLKRLRSVQVTSENEKQIAKGTALAWFKKHRGVLEPFIGAGELQPLDTQYQQLLALTSKNSVRTKYAETIKATKGLLSSVATRHAVTLAKDLNQSPASSPVPDPSPPFQPLIADPKMRGILRRRWQECVICVKQGAALGAVVMMGGLLEGMLLARINQLPNQTPVFTASKAPKDKAGKTLPLTGWMLKNYIDVAHELGWITTTAKDVGEVLRDYRNYIHPQKELSHSVNLMPSDAEMLWNITKGMLIQLLKP